LVRAGALALAALFAAPEASAALISGGSSLGWTGSFQPEDGSGNLVDIGSATYIDFFPDGPGGVAVTPLSNATGDLAVIGPLTVGTITDFALVNAPIVNFVAFLGLGGESFSLDINTLTVVTQNSTGIVLRGNATLNLVPGFDPTPGTYAMSFNSTGGMSNGANFEFTFSAGAAAVPEPATLGLFGLGLLGLGAAARRRRNALTV
jgi:hypothetical protein